MASLTKIDRTRRGDQTLITASPRRFAWLPSLLGAAFVFYIARLVYLAGQAGPGQPGGALAFSGLLVILACGLLLGSWITFRSRIRFSVDPQRVMIERIGLFKRSTVQTPPAESECYLVVAKRSHGSESTHRSKAGRGQVARVDVVDAAGARHGLIHDVDAVQAVTTAASAIAQAWSLPDPIVIDIGEHATEEIAYLTAHRDYFADRRDESLQQMSDQVTELRRHRDAVVDNDIDGGQGEVIRAMDSIIDENQRDLTLAEFDASLDPFDQYTFTVCRPGEAVRYERIESDSGTVFAKILQLPGTVGVAILIFIITPMIVPLTAALLMFLLKQLPTTLVGLQLQYAILDLCTLNLKVFLWTPVLFSLYLIWTWVKVDASMAPFHVHFDWPEKQLRLRRPGNTGGRGESIHFGRIQSFSTAIVHRKRARDGETWDVDAMLFAELAGRRVPILELRCPARSATDVDGVLDRFEPLSGTIAHFIGVNLSSAGERKERFDAVGFPYRNRLWHAIRIFGNASAPTRRSAAAGLVVLFGLVLALFAWRSVANRDEAERRMRTLVEQRDNPAASTEVYSD